MGYRKERNIPLDTNKFHIPPSSTTRSLQFFLQLPSSKTAAGAGSVPVRFSQDDVRDGLAGESDGDFGAIGCEEVFELVV